ncbi:fructose-bisphosphate aldolase [Nocardia brasiliensis]|uniref:Fructose-bisphosphate aldolase n=1 Tax=Nocardia brasiliensis TaxID=37326 RepID=A0A6G9XTC2_NOCBR|nr:glycoside hydrolase family 76 protein [Nocardia brasiliensis]QIS04202.1 fructose-bisphosphate aldolase [Nocardia brasiliensis]
MDRRSAGISRRRVLLVAGASIALTTVTPPTRAVAITGSVSTRPEAPAGRADLAEQAIASRHVRALWGHPHLRLGTLVWPSSLLDQSFARWCYWWQAHLLDCAVDAAARARTPERVERVLALARGIRTRNITGWTNRYYDDMSWLALALERAERLLGLRFDEAIGELTADLIGGWNPAVGALPWRSGDEYYNTPAIGPAGIALARTGELTRATRLAEFLHTRLRDSATGLILDGVHEPGGRVERTPHTYCQGVAIGLDTELATRTGESKYHRRATTLIDAVADRLTDEGVIAASAADDSGLFMGILARYLAEAALALNDSTAAQIVHASAQAAWRHRAEVDGLPLFGVDWTRPVPEPTHPPTLPQLMSTPADTPANLSRDLSVQLSAWMLLEADHRLSAAGR